MQDQRLPSELLTPLASPEHAPTALSPAWQQMALETRSRLEAGIIGGGHRVAAARLDAQRSTAGFVSEAMGGLSYLDYIRALVPRIDSDWPGVQVGSPPFVHPAGSGGPVACSWCKPNLGAAADIPSIQQAHPNQGFSLSRRPAPAQQPCQCGQACMGTQNACTLAGKLTGAGWCAG